MSKALEVLDNVREDLIHITAFVSARNKEISVMYSLKENGDIKRYVDNVIGLKEIEKELKALEIIRKHKLLNPHKNAVLREMYNLSDEEWESLQEVFYEIRS